jgi:enoyl-CoA hydratase/carnithine racemase
MFDLRIENNIARLTLDRPEARNAITVEEWRALATVAAEAGQRASALVLRANGTAFCAGADISEFARFAGDEEARANFRRAMREGIEALAGLPIPTIAAIDGACYGAGVALAMACDVRIAGRAASFAITPAKFGIGYPQEDVSRLHGFVGPGQAARLLLSAAAIDAAEAVRIGLVEVLAEEGAAAAAVMAGMMAANDPESIAMLKQALRLASAGRHSDEGQDLRFDRLLGSERLQAVVRARGERRT